MLKAISFILWLVQTVAVLSDGKMPKTNFSSFELEQLTQEERAQGNCSKLEQRLYEKKKALEDAMTRIEKLCLKEQEREIPWLLEEMPAIMHFTAYSYVPYPRRPKELLERAIPILDRHPEILKPLLKKTLRGHADHRTKRIALDLIARFELVDMGDDVVAVVRIDSPARRQLMEKLEGYLWEHHLTNEYPWLWIAIYRVKADASLAQHARETLVQLAR